MSIPHDSITATLGCGDEKFFLSSRAFTMWIKLHKKKCDLCSRAKINTINIVAKDSVSDSEASRENYRQIKEVVAETMRKGLQLKSVCTL